MKKLTLIIFLMMGIKGWAKDCSLDGLAFYSYSASIEKQTIYEFLKGGEGLPPERNNPIVIHSCQDAATLKKSLVVTLAPLEYGITTKRMMTQPIKEITESNCYLENSPFGENTQKFTQKLENNKQKLRFIDHCVEFEIKHSGQSELSYKEEQEYCQIEKVDGGTAIARGGRCIFDINPDSSFKLKYNIRKECLDTEYLKKHDLKPMEVITKALVFAATGVFTPRMNKTLVGNKILRFNIEPMKKQETLSFDFGLLVPQYFANYYLPEVHFGKINIKKTRNKISQLNLNLVVDNQCKEFCYGGLCSSPCDYTQPLVGEFELFERGKRKDKIIKSWFEGGAIPANFQGLLPLMPNNIQEIEDFEVEKTYVMKVRFVDPHFDYLMYRNSFKNILAPIPGFPSGDFHSRVNRGVPTLGSHEGIKAIEGFNGIGEFRGSGGGIGRLGRIGTIGSHSYWPAEYERVCNPQGTICKRVRNRSYLEFEIIFSVEKNQYGRTKLKDLVVKRKSSILENYTKNNPDLAFQKCK